MSFPLVGQSVTSFYANTFAALSTLGVHFLRQRRARLAADEDPDFAAPRPVNEVERYWQ